MLLRAAVSPRGAPPRVAHTGPLAEVRGRKSPRAGLGTGRLHCRGRVTNGHRPRGSRSRCAGHPLRPVPAEEGGAPGRPQVQPLQTQLSRSFRKCTDVLRVVPGRHGQDRRVCPAALPLCADPDSTGAPGSLIAALPAGCRQASGCAAEPRSEASLGRRGPERGEERVTEEPRPRQRGGFHRDSSWVLTV